MTIAALDYGLKWIGLAVARASMPIALPARRISAGATNRESVERVLAELAAYGDLKLIIVGLPLLLNGQKGNMAQQVELFVRELQQKLNVPIKFLDERLSSAQAERELRSLSYSRKKRAPIIDSTAAMLLLQTYLAAELHASYQETK